jgi:hypothetical protein
MPPRFRQLLLTAHVTAPVGWLGAVLAFLALAAAGLLSDDVELVRGAYLTMEPVGRFVRLPLALFATILLLAYLQTLARLADAARVAPTPAGPGALRNASPALHGLLALLLLLVATALAVYKPRGLTPVGQRERRRAQRR